MPKNRIPSYRLHKATGQAVVVLNGRSHYLGIFGSPESRAKYDDLIAKYLILGRNKNEPPQIKERSKSMPQLLASAVCEDLALMVSDA